MSTTVGASLYGGPILTDVLFRTERYGESGVFVKNHLPRLRKGGVNAIVTPGESLREIEIFLREVRQSDGEIELATTPQEVCSIVARGACACILAASYSTLGDRLDSLPMLHQLGIRLFTLSGNRRNYFVDGCTERTAGGLSHLGIDLVKALESLGIIIDVSHTSERGVADVFEFTDRAVIVASHSNTRQICDTVRNASVDQIKTIGERGGMIGVSLHPTLVTEDNPDVTDVAHHMRMMMELTGPEHVGVGTDFVDYAEDVFQHKIKAIDPTGKLYGGVLHPYPRDIESIEKFENIFVALTAQGVDEDAITKMRGENVLRVLGLVS